MDQAGFEHVAAVEIDKHACATLQLNRPRWRVYEQDLKGSTGAGFQGVDLLAGGVPCPPFSIAGTVGANDERNLFPEALRLVEKLRPTAVMLENVRGSASEKFERYRTSILRRLERLGTNLTGACSTPPTMGCLSSGLDSARRTQACGRKAF